MAPIASHYHPGLTLTSGFSRESPADPVNHLGGQVCAGNAANVIGTENIGVEIYTEVRRSNFIIFAYLDAEIVIRLSSAYVEKIWF